MGMKGVLIPTENSPKEEWDTFYQKVGVPLEDAKYKEQVKLSEDVAVGKEFGEKFVKLAHELRVHPNQAKKIFEFFDTEAKTTAEKYVADTQAKTDEELSKLYNEWGPEAYNVKLSKANKFLAENADKDFVEYLKESGLGKNPSLIKAFTSMAEKFYKEGSIPSADPKMGMTIDDINREINSVFSNFDDPYHKPSHADHKRRVDEIQSLYSKLDRASKQA
jgi:hypothetical protein